MAASDHTEPNSASLNEAVSRFAARRRVITYFRTLALWLAASGVGFALLVYAAKMPRLWALVSAITVATTGCAIVVRFLFRDARANAEKLDDLAQARKQIEAAFSLAQKKPEALSAFEAHVVDDAERAAMQVEAQNLLPLRLGKTSLVAALILSPLIVPVQATTYAAISHKDVPPEPIIIRRNQALESLLEEQHHRKALAELDDLLKKMEEGKISSDNFVKERQEVLSALDKQSQARTQEERAFLKALDKLSQDPTLAAIAQAKDQSPQKAAQKARELAKKAQSLSEAELKKAAKALAELKRQAKNDRLRRLKKELRKKEELLEAVKKTKPSPARDRLFNRTQKEKAALEKELAREEEMKRRLDKLQNRLRDTLRRDAKKGAQKNGTDAQALQRALEELAKSLDKFNDPRGQRSTAQNIEQALKALEQALKQAEAQNKKRGQQGQGNQGQSQARGQQGRPSQRFRLGEPGSGERRARMADPTGKSPNGRQGQKGQGQKGQGQKGQGQKGQGQKGQGKGAGTPLFTPGKSRDALLELELALRGKQAGTGRGSNMQGDEKAGAKANNVDELSAGNVDRGEVNIKEAISRAARGGVGSRAYRKIFAEYDRFAEEVLEEAKVPPGRRALVERYFDFIQPQN